MVLGCIDSRSLSSFLPQMQREKRELLKNQISYFGTCSSFYPFSRLFSNLLKMCNSYRHINQHAYSATLEEEQCTRAISLVSAYF